MHTKHTIKGIEELVDERIQRWEAVPSHMKEQNRIPVLAISREEGSLGEAVAARVAEQQGMDYYDDQLIRTIAETAHISESVVRTLDEKGSSFVDDLFRHAVGRFGLTSDRYFDMLANIIAAINWHGNGVIVGRGSAYLIHGPTDLTVRFVAPKAWRIDNLMRERGLTKAEATRRIREADRDRREFVRHYFHVPYDDVRHFDLVINNEFLGIDESVELIRSALSHCKVVRSLLFEGPTKHS